MSRGAMRTWLVASAAGLLVVAVGAAVLADSDGTQIAAGQIYSTDNGDPIDVLYGPGDTPGTGCMNVGRVSSRTISPSLLLYTGSSVSCFELNVVEKGGTYQLVIPASAKNPAVVVGVMPAGATGATVGGVGRKTTRADTRGRWFLASLEPAAPSVLNLATISVEFDGS